MIGFPLHVCLFLSRNVIAEIGPLAISRPPDGRSPGGFRPTAVAREAARPARIPRACLTYLVYLFDLSFICDISEITEIFRRSENGPFCSH
jgi:hypothetical protein